MRPDDAIYQIHCSATLNTIYVALPAYGRLHTATYMLYSNAFYAIAAPVHCAKG